MNIRLFLLFILSTLWACQNRVNTLAADKIYHNGSIVPMTGVTDVYDAISVRDGAIISVGSWEEIKAQIGTETEVIDLKGKCLLPGFIDGHSHFVAGMEHANYVNLWSPPFGSITNIPSIVSALKRHKEDRDLSSGEWILAFGYDPDLLQEERHPNKMDLDEAFPDNPVFMLHVSGHLGVLNSAALKLVGISKETADPQGGQIDRIPGSKDPIGVIKEAALLLVQSQLPKPKDKDIDEMFGDMQDYYASCGITTAQDGFTKAHQIDMLMDISERGMLDMDLIGLVGFTEIDSIVGNPQYIFNEYRQHFKLGGIKLITDGSPQGKTALMKDPYLTEVPGCAHDCRGIAILPEEALQGLVSKVYASGIQLYIHSNGDAAIDMFLEAHRQALEVQSLDSRPLRTVVIHSQFMRPDLVEQYRQYGIIPSYFTNHTFFWGDVHVRNMGSERAAFTSPLRASIDAGLRYTNHTDYPITPHDQLFTVWSAVNRVSRSDQVIGPDERVTAYEALEAITIHGAYQYREEDRKGTLEAGKIADFVILSENPVTAAPMSIKDIRVEETIKEGKTIYARNQ